MKVIMLDAKVMSENKLISISDFKPMLLSKNDSDREVGIALFSGYFDSEEKVSPLINNKDFLEIWVHYYCKIPARDYNNLFSNTSLDKLAKRLAKRLTDDRLSYSDLINSSKILSHLISKYVS